MLSLCIIVKPTNQEAKMLDRCLKYSAKYVDEICITITGNNAECEKVADKYGANVSHFKWVNNFAKARNFNFEQATGKYILWLDADDVLKGGEKLKGLIERMDNEHIDTVATFYLYSFDKYKKCDVKHTKTRIVRKDAVEWVGMLHEDFREKRLLNNQFAKEIEVLHLSTIKRSLDSKDRNIKIAEQALKKSPDDPRSYWLAATSYMDRDSKKAEDMFKKFIKLSDSEEEKYLAYLSLGDIYEKVSKDKAIRYVLSALNLRPSYPNAYFKLARYNYDLRKLDIAKNYIEIGIQLPRPELDIVVFNPREYDLYPLLLLADIHYDQGNISKSLEIIRVLRKTYKNSPELKQKSRILTEEMEKMLDVDKVVKKILKIKDREELRAFFDNLDPKLKQHPKIIAIKNTHFYKKKSSGKDLYYFCYPTKAVWNPESQKIGGSEEAVINLTRELAELGWNVTVFNNCGKEPKRYGKVMYKPFWHYNARDKVDVTVIWRMPQLIDHKINSSKVYLDLHDVVSQGEFTEERRAKLDGVFVKSKAHRDLFPDLPDDFFHIISNGINPITPGEKDPYLILNTSSPDRHLDATLDTFEELIKEQPDKPWKLAWFYGWELFDEWHKGKRKLTNWANKQKQRFRELMEKDRAIGGVMLSQQEIEEWYKKAKYFLYPTQFYEINCISVLKAQSAGCITITSDFAALKETNKDVTIHTEGNKWGKDDTFGDISPKYLEAIKNSTQPKINNINDKYQWKVIAKEWDSVLSPQK